MGIAIIGGGFSGLLAAYLLEKRGIQVTVYEKEEIPGGHCRTLMSRDLQIEMGTVFCFSEHIKALLIELDVPYTERFTYRNFLNSAYQRVEHISREKIAALMDELERLGQILSAYEPQLSQPFYGYVHEDLQVSLYDFLNQKGLMTLIEVLSPYVSSFGFGSIHELQAYYAFNIFSMDTISAFIRGEKLLFVEQGMSTLIQQLIRRISDVRYASPVKRIYRKNEQVCVETCYGESFYDKVLISTKLPSGVISDEVLDRFMRHIDTHPYFTCAFEVENRKIVTTYYKANLGEKNKVQFFHTFKQNDKTLLVAYAYGCVTPQLVSAVSEEVASAGASIKHLITAKQWHIFPHVKTGKLTSDFYTELSTHQKTSPICLMGSLISRPAISNLYATVKSFVDRLEIPAEKPCRE